MKRPPWERDRLVRLIRVTLLAGVLIVAVGLVAVVGGVFDPSRSERARDWVAREYQAKLGSCRELAGQRMVCDVEVTTPRLNSRLGPLTPDAEPRICVFVLDNASVVLDGWASGGADEPCGPTPH
jgi:hypothetical protein